MARTDPIALLKNLINRPSVTPADGGCLPHLERILAQSGYHTQRLPKENVDNLYAQHGHAPPRLLFAGHVDVVPPGDLDQWHSPPFRATEKDGLIIGRGAADMKSAVAAMVAAAANRPRPGTALFFTSDEEGPARHGTRHFTEWWQAQNHPPIEYTIVGEPTSETRFGDSIKIGRRGSLTARLTITGRQTHAAYAHRGDNPAHRLARLLARLADDWQPTLAAQARGAMTTTFQIVHIQSGAGADNVTPPTASAVFNFRHTPADSAAALQSATDKRCREHAPGAYRLHWTENAPPYLLAQDSPLIDAATAAIAHHTGLTPNLTTSGGASDGRFLRHISRHLIEFGVLNTTLHEANECVAQADVQKLAAIYDTMTDKLI